MIRQVCKEYGKWPHEFFDLDVFEQNLAVLCMADKDAARALLIGKGALPVIDVGEVA